MNQKWKVVLLSGVTAFNTAGDMFCNVAYAQQAVNVTNATPLGSATIAASNPVNIAKDQIFGIPRTSFSTANASTVGSTAVTLLGPAGSSLKWYITNLNCFRLDAGTTAAFVTLSDSATTIMGMVDNGGGGGFMYQSNVGLQTLANATFSFTMSANISTVVCNVQAYNAT